MECFYTSNTFFYYMCISVNSILLTFACLFLGLATVAFILWFIYIFFTRLTLHNLTSLQLFLFCSRSFLILTKTLGLLLSEFCKPCFVIY